MAVAAQSGTVEPQNTESGRAKVKLKHLWRLKKRCVRCHECVCNSRVVLLQLQRQPAVPLKRKRRYCELPELDVLSPGLVDGSNQYSHTVSYSVSRSLFDSGRLKERTVSSHQTAVSPFGSILINSSEECIFDNRLNMYMSHYFTGGEL